MEYKILIAGCGGQGILSLGKMFACAAMKQGFNVTYYPSYGAEVRGGTAKCGVIISDNPIASPIVYEADSLIAFNEASIRKYLSVLKNDGTLVLNSSLISNPKLPANNYSVCFVQATKIAKDLGIEKAANMVMAGSFLNKNSLITQNAFWDSFDDVFGNLKKELKQLNIEAFKEGLKYE